MKQQQGYIETNNRQLASQVTDFSDTDDDTELVLEDSRPSDRRKLAEKTGTTTTRSTRKEDNSDDTDLDEPKPSARQKVTEKSRAEKITNNQDTDSDDDIIIDDGDDSEDSDDLSTEAAQEEAYQRKMAQKVRRGLQEAREMQTPGLSSKKSSSRNGECRTLREDEGNCRQKDPKESSKQKENSKGIDGRCTFYGKPVFDSTNELDVLTERCENSGTMPYRIGEVGPWLASLRRPVNYAEIYTQETKQKRMKKKFEDRCAQKTYSEMFAEKKLADAMNVETHGECNSTMCYPAAPSDNTISRTTFLPPISTAEPPPSPVKVATSRDGQKVSIDINLTLPSSRQPPESCRPSNIPMMSSCDQLCSSQDRYFTTPRGWTQTSSDTSAKNQTLWKTHPGYPNAAAPQGSVQQPPYTFRPSGYGMPYSQPTGMAPCCCPLNMHHGYIVPAPVIQQQAMTSRPDMPAGRLVNQKPTGLTTGMPSVPSAPLKSHRHVKRGRHGEYQVFCVDDYNKLKRELKFVSSLTAEKDAETLQEKKEKLAVQQGYGKLVSDKNRQELLRAKRLQAEMLAV